MDPVLLLREVKCASDSLLCNVLRVGQCNEEATEVLKQCLQEKDILNIEQRVEGN